MASIYDETKCAYCMEIPVFSRREGQSVCKCETKGCAGNERWLTPDEWEDLRNSKWEDTFGPDYEDNSL